MTAFELSFAKDKLTLSKEMSTQQCDELIALQTLLNFDLGLSYPLTIFKQESPDFQIEEQRSQRRIGIEHTIATHSAWEESCNHLMNQKDPMFSSISRCWLQGQKKSGRELGKDIASKQDQSLLWCARDSEKAKAEEIIQAVRNKSQKLVSGKYKRYSENWLLIVDSWLFFSVKTSVFTSTLDASGAFDESPFDRIFFLCKTKDPVSNSFIDSVFELSESDQTQLSCWE